MLVISMREMQVYSVSGISLPPRLHNAVLACAPGGNGGTSLGASVWCLQLETSHCCFYPGQKAGDPSFNTWRFPIFFPKGNNALGLVATHEGTSRVSLWVERRMTELGQLLALLSSLPGWGLC